MALEDAVQGDELALEGIDQIGMTGDHTDEGSYVEPQPAGVEDGVVAGDHAGRLELLDALEHRWGAQSHVLADAGERGSAVVLEQGENAEVRVVELRVLMVTECHKVLPGRE